MARSLTQHFFLFRGGGGGGGGSSPSPSRPCSLGNDEENESNNLSFVSGEVWAPGNRCYCFILKMCLRCANIHLLMRKGSWVRDQVGEYIV